MSFGITFEGGFVRAFYGDDITIDESTSPATFTGSGGVLAFPPVEVYSGVSAWLFGLSGGTVTQFMRSSNGTIGAGAGAVVLDDDGIHLINNQDISSFIFNDPFIQNSGGDIGNLSQSNGDRLSLDYNTYGNEELLSNPGFEAGALTNWTAAGAGTWSAQTTTVYQGAYAARCLISGTSQHTLTSDRIVISNFDLALIVFYRYDTLVGWTEKTAYVNWYDATSGGNLLQSDSVDLGNVGANSWRYKILRSAGPGNALSCEVVLTATSSSGTPSVYFDAIRLRAHGHYGAIEIRGTMKGAIPQGNYSVGAPPVGELASAVGPYWVDENNTTAHLHYGDYAGYSLIATNATTQQTIYSRTIKANSMGPNGTFHCVFRGRVRNTGATSVGATIDVIFGSATLFTVNTTATGTTNDRTIPVLLDVTVTNQNSASAQTASTSYFDKLNGAGGTSTVGGWSQDIGGENRATQDTTADKDFTIRVTLTTGTNSIFEREAVYMFGPYYQA